jgi:YVTN family beta-propeller protein
VLRDSKNIVFHAGTRVLVANMLTANISVINTAYNSVSATWTTLSGPAGIAIFGNNVYVANQYANSLSVHNLATGAVLSSVTGLATQRCDPDPRWQPDHGDS